MKQSLLIAAILAWCITQSQRREVKEVITPEPKVEPITEPVINADVAEVIAKVQAKPVSTKVKGKKRR